MLELEYAEPQSVREACQLLEQASGQAEAIAGGTDLVMSLKNGQKTPRLLVDLSRLDQLKEIHYSQEDGLTIGACVSVSRLTVDPLIVSHYPLLTEAAHEVGTPQLQAMGTIAGNLCQDNCCMYFNRSSLARQPLEPCHKLGGCVCHVVHRSKECWATYAGDLAPVLMVLGAQLRISSSTSQRVIPVGDLFSNEGIFPQSLRLGELITSIQLPIPHPNSGGTYRKLRQRETLDYPLVGVAVSLATDPTTYICEHAAVALTAVGRAPLLIHEAEALKGKKIESDGIDALAEASSKQAQPMKNLYGPEARYRLSMVKAYVRSAIERSLAPTLQPES